MRCLGLKGTVPLRPNVQPNNPKYGNNPALRVAYEEPCPFFNNNGIFLITKAFFNAFFFFFLITMVLNWDGSFITVANEKTFYKEETHFMQSHIAQSPGL